MIIDKPIQTLTDRIRQRLKGLRLHGSIKIADDELLPKEEHAWRHAARSLGMKVSIRTTPAGVRAWRVR